MNMPLQLLFSTLFIATSACSTSFVPPLHGANIGRLHLLQGEYLLSLERGVEAERTATAGDKLASSDGKCGGGGQTNIAAGDPYAPGIAEAYGLTDSTSEFAFI